ncbi:AraC family transcriptional regulator [Arcobacter sp. CECT 8983]|uniref:helix-turn-helix domain-containing protein n=1 Tax=Arcobacter sp. CECT 8983 TaxID=2044508 RepID=UPI00100B2E80|nr:AraC family transcriptional regulator [Arcobacter sp. CECT 8983]RXJ90465.1 AraC family transcriptional regulator [Arcobacter sp. CECT 8983]
MKTKIFKSSKLNFLELRYIKDITQCQKMHLHEELTITAIKEGSLHISFNDSFKILNPNEIAIINSNTIHNAILNSEIVKDGYVLYIDKTYLQSLNLGISLDYTFLQDDKNSFINLCEVLLAEDISLLEKEEIFVEFCLSTFSFQEDIKEVEKNSLAAKIKNYLDENFLEDIVLEDISKEFDITVVHLIRVFKKQFGLAIHSYIINKKVHKAKELLNSNLPIIQVALQSGFFDQSHLNRSFKRVFQITPKQFQKNLIS